MQQHKRTAMVPFSEIELLLNHIKEATGASINEIMLTIGYNSNGLDNKWRAVGEAPRRVKYALTGMLNELKIKTVESVPSQSITIVEHPVHTQQLTYQELAYLFVLVGGTKTLPENHRELMNKLAQMMLTAL